MERWQVSAKHTARGDRLDRFLAERTAASRAQVRRWLERGAVCVDGQVVTRGGTALLPRQAVTLERPASSWVGPMRLGGESLPLEVLATGADWVAVNKPAGVAVHPLEPDEGDTLAGAVAAAFPEMRGVGDEGELRSGVVHRLDVDTSGVVLFALDEARWARLREAFRGHRVRKSYDALVAGHMEGDGRATRHLAVTRHRPAKVAVVEPGTAGGRACSLAWEVRAAGPAASWARVALHTGFLHQVRVMFAAMGHPLLGDAAYAPPAIARQAPRQMLHASSIAVDDVAAEAPFPEDFRAVHRRVVTA